MAYAPSVVPSAAAPRDTGCNNNGTIMSGYYKQMRHGADDARRKLEERLAREEMGDARYQESVSHTDDRAFKIFGVVFIVVFGIAVLIVTWLGY